MNFDDIKRQAERHLGKDIVDKAEKVVRKKIEKEANKPTKHIIDVEDVKFTNEVSELIDEAKDRLKNNPETQSPVVAEESSLIDQNPESTSQNIVTKENNAKEEKAISVKSPATSTVDSHSANLLQTAVEQEYRYGRLGLGLGLSCIVGGIILGLNGVAGSTSWTAKLLALESEINDAAPGVVIFVVGMFMVWITKPKVKMKNLKG
jgi:hypothetical protein